MRLFRYALTAVLLGILGVAIYQTLLWLGVWGNLNDSQVKELDDGDEEIALIEPATSIDDWGRLVTALKLLQLDWPKINPTFPQLRISFADAFPPLTAEVPEIVFEFADAPARKLRLRWYKISGEHIAASWVQKLHERSRPPLAIIGGTTSDRAVKLAKRLQETYPDPDKPSPVLLITTATAEKTKLGNILIGLYKDRAFRFSFTNKKMVKSLLNFVEHRQYPDRDRDWAQNLWVNKPSDPPIPINPGTGTMHAVTWADERYSQDMNALFEEEFKEQYPKGDFIHEPTIPYSVGGFFHRSPQEQNVVDTFLALQTPIKPHSFLVLPTQAVRMRRFLVNLRLRSLPDARNLVILNGDAISFNTVFRDRDVVWNILDLPYSLVFFAHRNPIDHAAGFTWVQNEHDVTGHIFPHKTTTGTHDILLYRDLFEAFLYAAYDQGRWLDDPLKVRDRLRATCWHQPNLANAETARVRNPLVDSWDGPHQTFFDALGDRQSHTGEHIVWVKPNFTDDRVDKTSKISAWSMPTEKDGGTWRLLEAYPPEEARP